MKKIGDKSSILSPITGFQTQKPFRKPSDSSPQESATTSNNFWTKASLKWKGSIKTGSIGLRSEGLDWMGIWCRDMQKGGYEFHATKKVSILIFCRKNCVILRQNCMCNECSNY